MKRRHATLVLALVIVAALIVAQWRAGGEDGRVIRFELPRDGEVSIGIRDRDGKIIRQLTVSEPMPRGPHAILWDGKDFKNEPAPPGRYRWFAIAHDPFDAKIRGWAGLNGTPTWPPDGAANAWGQHGGSPSALAADERRVYLGWSGGGLVAGNLDGGVFWSTSLPDHRHVQAIAVDDSTGYVLARDDRGEDAVLKFDLDRGDIFWSRANSPLHEKGLRILDLWPADATTRPARADAMAVRAGRIYLTFTDAQFMCVLDAASGAYLQTIVGGSPEFIDVTPTQTQTEDGALVPADFAMLSLREGGLGKVLFAHDPLWVMTSVIDPLDAGERITALSILGDTAPRFPRSLFLGLGSPFNQVQRREILASEGYVWSAGTAGGRASPGPWQAPALAPIRAVALDARGRLWVAEGDAAPARFSVWSTEGNEGRLEAEYFGPVSPEDTGAALLPSDPEIAVGAGCEWRIDPRGGAGKCLGVISGDGMTDAEFFTGPSRETLLRVHHPSGDTSVFERRGAGDYKLRERQPGATNRDRTPSEKKLAIGPAGAAVKIADTGQTWLVSSADGLIIGSVFGPPSGDFSGPTGRRTAPVTSLVHAADGRYFAAASHHAVIRFEIFGLSSIHEISGAPLTVPAPK